MPGNYSKWIDIIPGTSAAVKITLSYDPGSQLSPTPDLTLCPVDLVVVQHDNSLDADAIFTVTTNSADPTQGQILWIIEIANSSLLIPGGCYWFRCYITDINSRRVVLAKGPVFTGSPHQRGEWQGITTPPSPGPWNSPGPCISNEPCWAP